MSIGPEEAKQLLCEIENVTSRAKKMIAYGGGDILFIVWGIIWFIGGLGTHFTPVFTQRGVHIGSLLGLLWAGLVGGGIVISYLVGRRGMPVKSAICSSIGLFWWMLYAFVYLWIYMLFPFIQVRGQHMSHVLWTHMGAIAATVPMFAYVVFGLFLERYLLWIGLGITVLMTAGVYLLEPYFYLWMALVGGGSLAGTGLFIRNRWRR